MAIYTFKKDDGELIEMNFPINSIPNSIKCDDGQTAKRIFVASNIGVVYKGIPDHWPSKQEKLKKQLTNKNVKAGEKGKSDWKQRMPKLVKQ